MKCWPWSHKWSKWVHVQDIFRQSLYFGAEHKVGEVWECRCETCGKPKRSRHFF
jgi:hypothetical protein